MELNYRSQRFLLVLGAICIFTSFIWCNFAIALEGREEQPSAQLVDKSKPMVEDAKTDNANYPATPEGVIEDFIKNNHSVTAMKRYYLNCEGIDCEGEVTPTERFMGLFDYDLDPCTTEGLRQINTRIMSGFKIKKINKTKNKARVRALYKVKGILVLACLPTPNVQFISYKNWNGIATYDLVKDNNKWKIRELFIDIQPPLPKSEKWAIEKIEKIIQQNANNSYFVDKAKGCITDLHKDKNCLIQKW